MAENEYKDLQVSGLTCFPETKWREAVLFYLFGLWGGKHEVTYRPKISFGNVTLRLDRSIGAYYAYGKSSEILPIFEEEQTIIVDAGKQADVEVALVRFVKDSQIRLIVINLPITTSSVAIWKKQRRGQYGCSTTHLPISWGSRGPIWF
ncbi:MAG: hypothetical protein NT141_04245 [candidate division WWE3 bacterium]|nr:hypothetical protein [candidate division WWE3 bacterium]